MSGMKHRHVWELADRFRRGHVGGIDNAHGSCTIEPRSALCGTCGFLRQDRYPTPPPKVGLFLECDVLTDMGPRMLFMHRILLDAVRPWLTRPVVTRCHSVPNSPKGNGDDYFVVALPQEYYTFYRQPLRDDVNQCKGCGRYTGAQTIGAYFYLTPAQHALSVWVCVDNSLLVSDEVKEKIDDRIKAYPHRWTKWPVREEPMLQHRVPEDGLGPAEPPPSTPVEQTPPRRSKSRVKPKAPPRTSKPQTRKGRGGT